MERNRNTEWREIQDLSASVLGRTGGDGRNEVPMVWLCVTSKEEDGVRVWGMSQRALLCYAAGV